VVLAPSTDTAEIFRLVEQEHVTVIAAVVPLISAWLASDEPKRFDHSSLKVVQNGGARLAPGAAPAADQRAGLHAAGDLRHRRGPDQHDRLDDPLDLILNSSGRPVCEDDEIAVVDDDGREVPDGEAGELITRGPYTIRGYYRAPEKNSEAFTADGFYRMGDIVRKWGRNIQAEGRRKDLINRGGEKISCEEVENFIHRHPAVKSACLVAMPDPVFGEKACAFVILREGESLTFEGLTTFLRGLQIASYKLPERLEVVTQFPLSPVGKILKRELRDAIAARLDAEAGV
jgi:2,3-dihydroxybenzoate-AMP ligase